MTASGSESPLLVAAFFLTALLAARTLFLRLVHRMEVRADAEAGRAAAYGRALAKIYEKNLVPVAMGGRRKTHPELYDRLAAVGAAADYPRPSAPPRGPWAAGMFVLVLGTIGGLLVVSDVVARRMPRALFRPAAAALWTAGAVGGTYGDFSDWIGIAPDRGDDVE